MKTIFALLSILLLTGCITTTVNGWVIIKAESTCSTHGGVDNLFLNNWNNTIVVTCRDSFKSNIISN